MATTINQINARSIFTRGVSEIYKDKIMPKPLFMSMAGETKTKSRYVSTEVRRYHETMAADIQRGTNNQRNQFTKSSQHLYETPYYNEGFDLTTLENYDRVMGQDSVGENALVDLMEMASEKLAFCQNKIIRATEFQWNQVMRTGIVTVNNGDNVNYNRKAESTVVVTGGNRWNESGADILSQIRVGCNFIRTEGKATTGKFRIIMGEGAYDAFVASSQIQNLGDQTFIKFLDLHMPEESMMQGGILHGRISAGSYLIDVYTYPEYYDTLAADGSPIRNQYWPSNMCVLLPKDGFQFTTKYAGIQALFKGGDAMPNYFGYVADKYFMNNYIDERNSAHVFEVLSAPLAVPVSVDQIYSMQVID